MNADAVPDRYTRSLDLYHRGELAAAAACCAELLAAEPRHAGALQLMGVLRARDLAIRDSSIVSDNYARGVRAGDIRLEVEGALLLANSGDGMVDIISTHDGGRQRRSGAGPSGQVVIRAGELAVPLFRMGREWQATPTAGGFRYDSDLLGLDLPAPALIGAHQIDNAATAVACVERLRSNGLDCSLAIGTTSEYPTCRDQLAKATCDGGLPATCGDAVHLLDP